MKKTTQLLLSLPLFLIFNFAYGNDCSTPEVIGSIPYFYAGTTVGAGNDYGDARGCNNTYLSGQDFVFEYNSSGNEVISIELENVNDDNHSLYVFDGCPDVATTSCLADGRSGNMDSVFIETVHFQNPGVYYIVVSSHGGLTQAFDFEISFTTTIGNICENAVQINNMPFNYSGTLVGSGNDYGDARGCSNTYFSGRDFVFEYSSGGDEVIGIELENLTDDHHSLFVFDGCPDDVSTSCLYGSQSGSMDSVFIETVHFQNPGSYYIVVSAHGGLTQVYDFEISFATSVGNICENAVQINNMPFNYSGTLVGSGNDYEDARGCSNTYFSGRDFVFEYSSGGDEVIGIELENLTDDHHSLFVFDGCPDDVTTSCMYGNQSGNMDSVFIETVHFENPGTYYIVVSAHGALTKVYDFDISFTTPIGNICENALQINTMPFNYSGTLAGSGNDYGDSRGCSNTYFSGRDFVFEYSSVGNEVIGIELENLTDDHHSLFVFDGCPDDVTTSCMYGDLIGNTDSVFIETAHFQNPGIYYIVVSVHGGLTQVYDFDISFTTPIGNICENARLISSFPYSFSGTTRETGIDYTNSDACGSLYMSGRDHVFEYTPSGNEYLDLSLTNLNDDQYGLFITEGCPNDPLALCYAFDTEGGTSPIMINTSACLTAGKTYYIIVSSYGALTGWYDFTLDIDQNLQTIISATETSGLTNDNYLCDNEAGTAIVNLSANASGGNGGTYSFLWDNLAGSTTSGISETPISSTTYTVTATDIGGCSVVEYYTIEVDPVLSPFITSLENSGIQDDGIICADDAGALSYTLDASGSIGGFGSFSYAWNTSDMTAIISEMPGTMTAYTVTVTDAHNCSESASQQVNINPTMTVAINSYEESGAIDDMVICGSDAGDELALLVATVSGGTSSYSFSWNLLNGANASLAAFPSSTTTYVVTVTDANGCIGTDDETIEVVSASCIWTGPTNMNWYDDPNYWSLGRFPTVCDHVVIPSGKSVTLRNGYHGWGNTLDVQGLLDTKPGAELDIVAEY